MFEHGNPMFYDYEDERINNEKYKQNTPVSYNMAKVNSTDIALSYTKNDWFNVMDDVRLLKANLTGWSSLFSPNKLTLKF